MTKRKDVLRRIGRRARERGATCEVLREGANHTVFVLDGLVIPIPRYTEIDNQLAEAIYKECAAKLGKD